MISVGQVYFCPFTKGLIVVTKVTGDTAHNTSIDYEGTKQLGKGVSLEVFVNRFEPVSLDSIGIKQKETLKNLLKSGVLLNGYIQS